MAVLDGKTIVIVGGTTGLGLSAASACAGEGASVVVVGRNPESASNAAQVLGSPGKVFIGDASDPDTALKAIQLAVETFGRLDGMYHVAGGSGRQFGDGPLHEITDDGWTRTLQLNLTSLFNSNRAAVRQFIEQGQGGSILNMSSVLGFSPSSHFATHAYAASKAAAVGMTTSCAAYYAAQNIRFNIVAPALVATPMSKRAQENEPTMKYIATKQPLDGGRIGKAEDLDAAVVYFLSDQSKFDTGQVLSIDGGWSVSEGQPD